MGLRNQWGRRNDAGIHQQLLLGHVELASIRSRAIAHRQIDSQFYQRTAGPAGPGDLLKPQKIVAGTDPVAVDAYCVILHSRKPKEVVMLAKAAAAGVGRADLQKSNVREIAI